LKQLLWLGFILTSASWLFFIPVFNEPDEKTGFILLILATLCNIYGFWKTKPVYFKERYIVLLIPLILSIIVIPYPFNIGVILFTIGYIISIILYKYSTNEKINIIIKGVFFTGFVLVAQAAMFPFYKILTSRVHQVDIFSPITSFLGNILRLTTSVNNGIVFVQTIQQTYPFTVTLEKLGFFMWFNILIGAIILFILFFNKRKILLHVVVFLTISIIYLFLRLIIFIHFYINTIEMEIFWNPWYMLLSFLPLGLLFMKILPLNNNKSEKKTVIILKLSKKNVTAMILIFILIFSIVGAFAFQDPGSIKNKRILIDEYHSEWEKSDKPLDKQWYGMLSTYNYYSWVEWLNHYFYVERNINETLTPELLSSYDILILKCPTNPYSDEEIKAIVGFVENGGGLFLIGDHTNVFGMNTFLNTVSKNFGLTFKTDATYELGSGNLTIYKPPEILPHTIVQNIKQFDFMTSCTLDAPFFSENVIVGNRLICEPGTYSTENFFSESVATTESEFGFFLQSAAVKHGKGRVVAFTDSTVFSSFSVFTDGYQGYSLGVLDYLNRTNTYAYLNTVFLSLAVILFILLVYLLKKERKIKIAIIFFFISLLSFSTAIPVFSYINTVKYQLPSSLTDYKKVCFVQEHSNFKISLKPSLIIPEEEQEYGTFYVWTQRIGFVPCVEPLLKDALQKENIIVLINPIKSFSEEDIKLVSNFIENGGKMLVMDSITNSRSTTNELISNFGMWINKKSSNLTLFDDKNKATILRPYLSISGGENVYFDEKNETQISVMNFYNQSSGKNGTIVVVVDSYTFMDANMGGVFNEPNKNQLKIFETEFFIFEELLKNN
jgi:hypothetical protein